jgi:hypothetical protein
MRLANSHSQTPPLNRKQKVQVCDLAKRRDKLQQMLSTGIVITKKIKIRKPGEQQDVIYLTADSNDMIQPVVPGVFIPGIFICETYAVFRPAHE